LEISAQKSGLKAGRKIKILLEIKEFSKKKLLKGKLAFFLF